MPCPRLRILFLTALIPICASFCSAGDKPVKFETVPAGAQVEFNGSVACTTPCSISLPDYYLRIPLLAFSKHGEAPISVRFLKEGCAPKTITITDGPTRWKDTFGIGFYTFYVVTSPEFSVHLDAADDSIQESVSPTSSVERADPTTCSETAALVRKRVVQAAMPAVVTISTPEGSGSGFLVSPDGLLVTNAHVVGKHQSVTVTFANGKSVETSKLYKDTWDGLAIARIAGSDFPYIKLSRNPPEPGADVFEIGAPGPGSGRQSNTVNQAIVGFAAAEWIETDAPLDRAGFGGPLLDRDGEVVGVNTLIGTTKFKGQNASTSSAEVRKLVRSHFHVRLTSDDAYSSKGDGKTHP
jgi:Trypsin-like peptidase domain